MATIDCNDTREIISRNKKIEIFERELARVRGKLQDLYRRADRDIVGLIIKANEQKIEGIMQSIANVNTEIELIRKRNRTNLLGNGDQSTLAF